MRLKLFVLLFTGRFFLFCLLSCYQHAAGMVGIGATLGLDRLVEHITGVRLEKKESLSDWRIRPLTEYVSVSLMVVSAWTDCISVT